MGFPSGSDEEGNGNPLQCSCLENPRDRGSWWAAVYGVTQNQTRLKRLSSSISSGSDGKVSVCNTGDLGSIPGLGRPLEKEMTAHFSILSWKIPWTAHPGRLPSLGSQRVGHD